MTEGVEAYHKNMTEEQIRARPSASLMWTLENCNFALKARLMSPPVPDGSMALTGQETHRSLETGDFSTLAGQQLWVAETAQRQADELTAEFFGDEHFAVQKEIRIYMTGLGFTLSEPKPDDLLWSGQADLVARNENGDNFFLCDWKVLYGDNGTAVDNRQLRSLAAAWGSWSGASAVRVALVQPLIGKPSVADFTADTLQQAESWMGGILWRHNNATIEDARAGAWCHWCPAKVWCPAYAAMLADTFGEVATLDFPPATKEEVASRVTELPAARLNAMADCRNFLTWMVEAIEDEMRRRIEAGDPDVGYFLTPGRKMKTVIGAQEVLDALAPHGVKVEDVLAAAKLSLPALRESVRVRSGGEKVNAAGVKKYALSAKDAAVVCECALLEAHCLEVKDTAPVLKKKTSVAGGALAEAACLVGEKKRPVAHEDETSTN